MKKCSVVMATVLACVFAMVAMAEDAKPEVQAPASPVAAAPKTVVDVAAADKDVSTLVGLLTTAKLDAVLKAGEYTVLAPTDAAFAALPKEELEALKADPAKLAGVLRAHVIAGKMDVKALVAAKTVKTLAGVELPVVEKDGKVLVGEAAVVKADIAACNGLILTIDKVILPK